MAGSSLVTVGAIGAVVEGWPSATDARRRRPKRQQLPAGFITQQSTGASAATVQASSEVTDARRLPMRQQELAGLIRQQSISEAAAAFVVAVVIFIAAGSVVVGGDGKSPGVEAKRLPILQQLLAGRVMQQ